MGQESEATLGTKPSLRAVEELGGPHLVADGVGGHPEDTQRVGVGHGLDLDRRQAFDDDSPAGDGLGDG